MARAVWVLENDGHNTPAWHVFASTQDAEKYIGRRFNAFGECVDKNQVTWVNTGATPDLYVHDHRKED